MTKQLYEEALADAKRLTAVAEDNAKRAVLEAVTPRIKQLIERELLNEYPEEEMLFDDEMTTVPSSPVPIAATSSGAEEAISPPDEEGKVTLDLDSLDVCAAGEPVPAPMFGEPVPAVEPAAVSVPEEEYVLGLEALTALMPVINNNQKLGRAVSKLAETVRNLKAVSKKLRETAGYDKQLARTISRVENMYDYVQERISDPSKKQLFEQKLETYFQELTKLKELKMSKKLKDLIKEDDAQLDLGGDDAGGDVGGDDLDAGGSPGELTLKLTGLPDDVDLDSVGVDLVAGEGDDVDAGDDLDLGGDESGDDEGGDLGDLDLGGDESGDQMESVRLSDDTIVEIDENMLRREIARMKKLRESDDKVPSNAGAGVDAAAMDDFGGGSDEGEAFLDGEVTTESEDLDEGDDDELDESEEMPPMAELQNRRTADEYGVSANADHSSVQYESIKRKIAFEKKVQERAKARGAALVKEAKRATGQKKTRISKEYALVAERHNVSVTRIKKLTEQAKKLVESRSNSVAQPAESKADKGLRKQLAEQNLLNVKLVFANKLLQNESLSKRQKAQVIERLDEARTEREAKLVYESLVKALSPSKPLREGRETKIIGSSSRITRRGSSPILNEGFETDRWAALAGITKKA